MLLLSQFLERMPKPMLREMHTKAYGKKGLIHNSLILSEVNSYFSEKSRAHLFFLSLKPWQVHCITSIYNSGSRGLEFHELRLLISTELRQQMDLFLLEAVRNLYLWRHKNSERGTFVYHGFEEFQKIFQVEMPPYEAPPSHWHNHQHMLDWHICLILSFAKLGKLRVNNTKTLHRRSVTLCEEALNYSKRLFSEAPSDEVQLILHFLLFKEWLVQKESLLIPSASALTFLKRNGFRLRTEFLKWWVSERFAGDSSSLFHFLSQMKKTVRGIDAAKLFWPMDPVTRISESKQTVSWVQISRPLRELWFMGYLDISVSSHAIDAIRLNESGFQLLAEKIEISKVPQPSLLPNFEIILPVSSPPRLLFLTACLAEVKNDEPFLRFILERDTYLKGLQSGFSEEDIEHFFTWNQMPENVTETLSEWASSYFGAKLSNARLLKISNHDIQKALSRFDHFMECVIEEIPSYGFMIHPEKENRILEILKNYGLEPGIQESEEPTISLKAELYHKDFTLPYPKNGEPDYSFKADSDTESFSQIMGSTKYGGDFCKLNTSDLFKVLRYAHMMGSPIIARIRPPEDQKKEIQEIQFNVKSLHLERNPYHAIVKFHLKDDLFQLHLDHIEEIKLLHHLEP